MIKVTKLKITSARPPIFYGVPATLVFDFGEALPAGDYELLGDTSFEARAPIFKSTRTLTAAADAIAFEVNCATAEYLERVLIKETMLNVQMIGPAGVLLYDVLAANPSINPTDIPPSAAPTYYTAEESDNRFATLQSVIGLTATANAIKDDTEQLITDVAAVETKLDDMIDHADALAAATDAKIDAVKSVVDGTKTELDAAKLVIDATKTKIDAMDAKWTAIETSVNNWLSSPVGA